MVFACWSYFLAVVKAFSSFLSVFTFVSNSVTGSYDILVTAGLLNDRKDVKSHIHKLNAACKVAEFLKTSLATLKDINEDLSGKVETAMVSLESLDSILQRIRCDIESHPQQKPYKVQKLGEIYSDLVTALNSIKLKVDGNNENLSRSTPCLSIYKFRRKLKQWATARQTKHQLKAIEDKIKDAEQKSLELMMISTSAAVTRLHLLQYFHNSGIWPVTNHAINPPNPPRKLCVKEELGNKFTLTWLKNDGDSLEYFELCYDEDRCLSIPLNGNVYKTEIGSPQVQPGRIYTMKIRGINEGGNGNWSNSVVARFTKPSPRKPNPPQVWMVSTSGAMISVELPKPYCETESPITKWNVQYIVDGLVKEWKTESYKVEGGRDKQKFELTILNPNGRYHFQVQAVNAEGKSSFSEMVSIKAEYKTLFGKVCSKVMIFIRTKILYIKKT